MASEDRRNLSIDPAACEAAFPRLSDALTLYVWRAPALRLARWAAAAGLSVDAVTVAEALLSALAFILFWNGRYWPGVIIAAAVTLSAVVGNILARCGSGSRWVNQIRRALEILQPPLWWWAWEHGLAAYGHPLEPVYAMMVLWVVVAGHFALRAIEALSVRRFNGMDIHAWRPLDSRFRLVSADRNPDLVIVVAALLLRRPDSGLVLVAWWTLISLIFHAVRMAQMTERQARGQTIAPWRDP